MTKAYIIREEEIIATVQTNLKNGADIEYAYDTTSENIDARREKNLVNSRWGKISRAKKWDKKTMFSNVDSAVEVNPSEFLVS